MFAYHFVSVWDQTKKNETQYGQNAQFKVILKLFNPLYLSNLDNSFRINLQFPITNSMMV